MHRYVDIALRIMAWGLMLFGFFLLILMSLGILHSPAGITLEGIIGAGILVELGRIEGKFGGLETKVDMLWSDFKKRKEF